MEFISEEVIAWIDDIKQKISPEESPILFNESVGCLKHGFFRAGYVISWVSIAESLKNKIYSSVNLGDKKAQVSWSKISTAESNKQSVDKLILEEAHEIGLIEEDDFSKLSFLWEQRCLFAHPYSKAPTQDDLKYIIRASVEVCLSKPLLYKKNYIDELGENIITKCSSEKSSLLVNNQEGSQLQKGKVVGLLLLPTDK